MEQVYINRKLLADSEYVEGLQRRRTVLQTKIKHAEEDLRKLEADEGELRGEFSRLKKQMADWRQHFPEKNFEDSPEVQRIAELEEEIQQFAEQRAKQEERLNAELEECRQELADVERELAKYVVIEVNCPAEKE